MRHLGTLPMGLRGVEEEEGTENVRSHLCSNPHTPSTHHPSKEVMGNAKNAPPSRWQTAAERHFWRSSVPAFSIAHPAPQLPDTAGPASPYQSALWSIPSHRQQFHFSQRISEAGALTLYQNEKRFEVAKFSTKRNALSLPYCTWDARKGSLQRRSKKKGSVLCSTATHCRDSDWHWVFQQFQKWGHWSELEVQRLKDHPFLQDESDQQITRIWRSEVQALNCLKSSFQWKIQWLNNPNK